MKLYKSLLMVTLCIFYYFNRIGAVPASPEYKNFTQRDGSVFKARYIGDEWFNLTETENGYTIVFDSASKTWFYAELTKEEDLVKTEIPAHNNPPLALKKKLHPTSKKTKEIINNKKRFLSKNKLQRFLPQNPVQPLYPVTKTGQQKLLVILVEFSDQNSLGSTEKEWEERIFDSKNSAKEYYKEVSYGKFNLIPAEEKSGIINNGIIGWLLLPYKHPDTGQNISEANLLLVKNAIIAADDYIDFSSFDINKDGWVGKDELFVIVVAAGYEGTSPHPAIWAHNSSLWGNYVPTVDGVRVCEEMKVLDKRGNSYVEIGEWYNGDICPLGFIVHEIGHQLDLPDLYDRDLSSWGIGNWCLMSYGSWNKIVNSGDSPSHLNIWCKLRLGWIDPEIIDSITYGKLLKNIENNPQGFKILEDPFINNRYFLLEYRSNTGFDTSLPGEGLLIWHINEDIFDNDDDSMRLIDMEEADGFNNIDNSESKNTGDSGDPYPGLTKNMSFNNKSNPNSNDYEGDSTNVSIEKISIYSPGIIMDIFPRRIKGYTKSYDEFGYSWYIYDTTIRTVGVKCSADETGKIVKIKNYFLFDNTSYTINIYSYFLNNSPGNLLYSQQGTNKLSGWRVITLDSSIPIQKGQKPFIEITMLPQRNYYYYKVPIDYFGVNSEKSYALRNNVYSIWQYDFNLRAMFTSKPLTPESGFSPKTGSKVITNNPDFSWNKIPEKNTSEINSLKYILRLDDDGEIENNFKYEYTIYDSAHFIIMQTLPDKSKWYYAVCSEDEYGTRSDWSSLQTFEVDLEEQPPLPFTLLFPDNGASETIDPELIWNEAQEQNPDQVVTYDLYIDNNENFSSPLLIKSGLSETKYKVLKSDKLFYNTIYYWRVRAQDNFNVGIWSDIRKFVTKKGNGLSINLISPKEGQETSLTPNMIWTNPIQDDTSITINYDLYIDNNIDFSSPEIIKEKMTDTTYSIVESEILKDHTIYFWKVKTQNNYNVGLWTDSTYFVTNDKNEPPGIPALNQPESGKIFYFGSPAIHFEWSNTNDIDPYDSISYTLWITRDKNFIENDIKIQELKTNSYDLEIPDKAGKYYWKVTAFDNDKAFTDSKVQDFIVEGVKNQDVVYKGTKPWWKSCFISYTLKESPSILKKIIYLRDEYIINNTLGKKFVEFYYKKVSILLIH
ncbi:MAG: M6 family metalloprotease domain-containing protein [Candidatus Firestonebacteria bacterium]|nr:M6 family metalloprotease domain-containing protein [Candidatus Firestonebacteria bacterium]